MQETVHFSRAAATALAVILVAVIGWLDYVTGDSTDRVDTRVLQVIYSFDRGNLPIYIGQQMDVYIDASLEHNPELSSFEAPTQP